MTAPKINYGFVAILDVLGASSYNIEESVKFLEKRDTLLEKLKNVQNELMKPVQGVPQPEVAVFGDTIVFTWAVGKEQSLKLLPGVALWLRSAIKHSLCDKLFLRGAFSIGSYIFKDATVLGPAISDAASWYQETDWFGVILTPACQFHLVAFLEHASQEPQLEKFTFDNLFVPYPVPLKNVTRRNMWAISWPQDFWMKGDSELNAKAIFASLLIDIPIPKGTETKYQNSLAFFEWYGREIFPRLPSN